MDNFRSSSRYIPTGEEVTLDYRNLDLEVDYPSDWFDRHTNSKPSVTISSYSGTEDELLRAVKGGIRSATLSIQTAKIFLHHYGLTMLAQLTEDWISFNQTIGLLGTRVHPWNIITVNEGLPHVLTEAMLPMAPQARGQAIPQEDPHNWTRRAIVLYILGIYRLVQVNNDEYADLLERRLSDQVSSEGGKGMSYHGARNMYSSWLRDRNFLKMVAAIDMFLYRFKDHPDSILRMGSLGSRFKDCAGLLSTGFAMSILNIDAGELMDWVFVPTMGNEVLRIARPGQEISKADSYFPYQSDMGLVTRSAYSSNANPYLFTWIHIIGSLIGHRRSQNARFIFEGNFADVGLNAVLVAWVFARGGDLAPQFDKNGEDYGQGLDQEDPAEEGIGGEDENPEDQIWITTQGRNPKAWFALLKTSGFRIPPVVARIIKRQRDKISEAREGTVGDHTKNNLVY